MNISAIFLVLFSTSNYAAADMNMLRGILPHLKSFDVPPVDEESKDEVLNHAVFATTECISPSCDPDSDDNWCTNGGGQCERTEWSSSDCGAPSGCGCCWSKEVLSGVDEDVEEYIEEVNPNFHCNEGYCVPNPNLPVQFLHDACGSDATECPQCDNNFCCPCPSSA